MRKYLLLTLISLNFFAAFAQIQFEKLNHDFGHIKEIDGPVEYIYNFTNAGTEAVQVTNVKASCGCTTPDWSKELVQPGGKGYVKASFNPHNRPGAFTKTITVFSTKDSIGQILTFHGFVVAKQKTISETYPDKTGFIRFESTTVDFGKLNTKGPVEKIIKIYNEGKSTVTFNRSMEVPNHLTLQVPDKIEGGQFSELKIVYNPSRKNEYGPVNDLITFSTTETENATKTLSVKAEIVDYFPSLNSVELAKLQKLEVNRLLVEFGSITNGSEATQEIEIKNTGKADLLIRKVSSNASYIKTATEKKIIKPGGKGKIKINYNAEGILGKDSKVVNIYSNDPQSPVFQVIVTGEVVKP